MRTSADGLSLVMRSEGFADKAYRDPGSQDGLPITIGFGHTAGVRLGDVCTFDQGVEFLRQDILWAENLVAQLVKVPLHQMQFDALVSFAFNMGPGARGVKDGFMTLANGNVPSLRRHLNIESYGAAADEFPKWANPPLPGLVIRRARERNLFCTRPWQDIPDETGNGAGLRAARAANAVPY